MHKLSTVILIVRLSILSLIIIGLTACGSDSGPLPVKAEFGGISDMRRNSSNVETDLRIAALDANDVVLKKGTITSPSVNINGLTISSTGLATQATYVPTSADAQVCGNINASGNSGAVTSVITLDGSGSMSETDPSNLRKDAAELFVQRMGPQDETSIGWFNDSRGTSPYFALRIEQSFTSDKSLLNTAISKSIKRSGKTYLWLAINDSINLLKNRQGTNKIAVILSDGIDTTTRTPKPIVDELIKNANAENIRIYTVGLEASSDSNLPRLSRETNGGFVPAERASDLVGSFSGIFSAAQASGCVSVIFSPPPPIGTSIQGGLQFKVNNEPLQSQFAIRF